MDDPNTTMTVTLGDLAEKVEERVRSGEYESPSEVVRARQEALEREEHAFDAVLKAKVEEAMADPGRRGIREAEARLDAREVREREVRLLRSV